MESRVHSIFSAARAWPVEQETPPRVELVEYERSYTIKADIQAAGADGVTMNVDAGVLTISSEDRSGFADGDCILPRLHSFRYTLALPDDADETSMSIASEGRLLILTFDRKRSPKAA